MTARGRSTSHPTRQPEAFIPIRWAEMWTDNYVLKQTVVSVRKKYHGCSKTQLSEPGRGCSVQAARESLPACGAPWSTLLHVSCFWFRPCREFPMKRKSWLPFAGAFSLWGNGWFHVMEEAFPKRLKLDLWTKSASMCWGDALVQKAQLHLIFMNASHFPREMQQPPSAVQHDF